MLKLDKTTFSVAGVMAFAATSTPNQGQERLFVDGAELTPQASLALRNHSPNGFAWGYTGSGAAQTALAICLHIFQHPAVATVLYQDFKVEFVSHWPLAKPFNIEIDVADFMLDHWADVSNAYQNCLNQTK